jgi:hypothetical protein
VRTILTICCVLTVASARAPAATHHEISLGDDRLAIPITAAKILVSVDGGAATDRPVHARADQVVMLYASVQAGGRWYTDAPGWPKTRPLAKAPGATLAWSRVEPAAANYSNEDATGFHFTPIDYRATPIDASGTAIAADVRPTLTPDHGHGVGTMRFQITVAQDARTIASPGSEARRGHGAGGLADAVTRISIRRDDTYLGYLTEMFGQPYIWGSAGITDASHQSEHLEGSDCADFVVYGARRMGKRISYTWTGGLPAVTKLLEAGTRGDDGIYRDDRGRPLPFTRPGDLVLFPRHVGVLVADRGTKGVLDDQDIMMHTLFDSPKEQPIADTGYADKPVELRRFK